MTETTVKRIGIVSLAGMTGVITWGMALLFGWPLLFFEEAIPGTGIGPCLDAHDRAGEVLTSKF